MRETLEGRLAVLTALGLVVGILGAGSPWVALLSLPLLYFIPRRALLVLAAVGVGWLLSPPRPALLTDKVNVAGEAKILSVPEPRADGQACDIEINGLRLRAWFAPEPHLSLGDVVRTQGEASPIREGGEAWATVHGLSGRYKGSSEIVREGPWIARAANRAQRSFVMMCQRCLPTREASLLPALAVNAYGDLSDEDQSNLRRTSTLHLISASGFHVLLLVMTLEWVLGWLPMPRLVRIAILVGAVGFFSLMAGLQGPIVRAAIMALAGWTGYLFRREYDALNGLGFAATLLLLIRPNSLFETGFQLMAVIIAGLCLFAPDGSTEDPISRRWINPLKASLVAWIAATPLIAYLSGIISVIGVVANVLVGFVVGPILAISCLAWACWSWFPAAAEFLLRNVVSPLLMWMEWVLDHLGPLSWSALNVPGFHWGWLILFYGLCLLAWRPRVRPA